MAQIKLTISADNKATQSVQKLNEEVQALSKTLSSITVKKDLTTQINALTKHYKALADAQAKITANANRQAIADEKLRQEQSKTALAIAKENTELERQNKIKAQTESITNRTARAKEKDAQSIKITISQTQKLSKQYADLLNQINALEKSYKKGTFDKLKNDISSYFNDVKGLDDSLKSGATTQEDYNSKIILATASLQGFKTEMATTRTESKNLHGTIKDIVSGFLKFQLSAMLVMKPLQMIRSTLSSINETLVKTEDAVIALQRVLPLGSASDSEIASRLYKIAADYGQTFENVSQIAQNFARTGMSWTDTIKATEAAVLALNVAELDATQASDGMIAILTQFGLKAEDLTLVVDKLNITADNAAVTTEKLLAALQRTGSAAANANLSLDETVAIVTALSQATGRSGENLGTALNSLIQYSSKASALDVFAGLSDNTANVVADYRKGAKTILDVWQAVAQEIQSLDTRQADLLDSYFSTEDGAALTEALDEELQDIYTELGGVYDTANTFRKNYFIALLGNMDTVEQAMGTLSDAAGYSQDENQKYLDTYTAKLNTLKAQWQEIANSEQGFLWLKKFGVDIGSFFLNLMQWTGGLRTSLILLGSSLTAIFAPNIIKGFQSLKAAISGIVNPFTALKKSADSARLAQLSQLSATKQQEIADQKAAIATQLKMSATATETEIRIAETAATKSQTIATKAQAVADEYAAAAAKAKALAMQSALFIIGLTVTAISAAVGWIQKHNQQQEESRKQTIENYRAIEDTYKALQKLNGQYKELADNVNRSEEQEKDFNDIENKLVEILKDKYNVLSLLTEGTNEYTEAVKRLADEEEKEYRSYLIDAAKASENGVANAQIGYGHGLYYDANITNSTYDKTASLIDTILKDSGVATSDYKDYFLDLRGDANYGKDYYTTGAQLYNYSQYKKAFDALQKAYDDAIKEGDYNKADTIANSKAWKNFKKATDDAAELIKDYFDTKVALLASNYQSQFGKINTQEQFSALQTWVQNQINAGEFYNDTINNVLASLIDFSKLETQEDTFWSNNIQDVKNKYDELIESLKELRDLEDESVNLEEKKAEYLEAQNELIKAQQALENAKNEATVRRFNQATGQWEWQVDEKKVAEAEEAVKNQVDSVEKAREELEKQAYDTIISLLDQNNPPTNDELIDLLDGLKDFLGEQFITDIKDVFKNDTNVDLNQPINQKPENTNNGQDENSISASEVDYHGIQVLRNADGTVATGKGINKDKKGDNGEVTWNGKTYKIENGGVSEDEELAKFVAELGLPDRTIFAYQGSIYGVLDGGIVKLQARANSYGDKSNEGYKALSDSVVGEYGSYDSGGIANGLGFMAKATSQPESVNDPELTKKILTPVSNAEFDRYVKDMGILFETARQYSQRPIIERVGGATDNRVDNSGQITMNGVTIGSDKRGNSLNELLSLASIVPNV